MKKAAIFSDLQTEALSPPPSPEPQGVVDARNRVRKAESELYAARVDLSKWRLQNMATMRGQLCIIVRDGMEVGELQARHQQLVDAVAMMQTELDAARDEQSRISRVGPRGAP